MRQFGKVRKKYLLKPTGHCGFTLLELLVSITLICSILVIILGGLRLSVRAWEKGEKRIDKTQMNRFVSDMIKHQFGSIFSQKILNDGKVPFYLKGDDQSLEFLSTMSLTSWNSNELRYVKYSVLDNNQGLKRLCFFEKRYFEIGRYFKFNEIDEDEFFELFSDKESIIFSYMSKNNADDTYEWVDSWPQKNKKKFPAFVRITFQTEKEAEPTAMIFPINIETP